MPMLGLNWASVFSATGSFLIVQIQIYDKVLFDISFSIFHYYDEYLWHAFLDAITCSVCQPTFIIC